MTSTTNRRPNRVGPYVSDTSAKHVNSNRLHAFEFNGVQYAYFPVSGDYARINEPTYQALRSYERGEAWPAIAGALQERFDRTTAKATLRDIGVLRRSGMVDLEVTRLEGAEKDKWVSQLMRVNPRGIMFFVTEACNLKCAYCYEVNNNVHDFGQSLKKKNATKVVDRYIEDTGSRTDLSITFFGGEPLLNFKVIKEVVAYSKEKAREAGKNIGFTMTTNLTLMTQEMADFLADEKFHVMVSIDGVGDQNKARVTVKGDETYSKVAANLEVMIDTFKRKGNRMPRLRATMNIENHDPVAIERELLSLGTGLVVVGSADGTVEGSMSHDLAPDSEAACNAHEAVLEHMLECLQVAETDPKVAARSMLPSLKKAIEEIHEDASRGASTVAAPKFCGACRNMRAVATNGDLYPCHRYMGMDAFKLGNIHAGGAEPERVEAYYDNYVSRFGSKCVDCWARYLCGGRCAWYLSTEDGEMREPDEAGCQAIRTGLEQKIGFYEQFSKAVSAPRSEASHVN